MLANVQQRTIEPVITAAVAQGALVHTDEYGVYARMEGWGYQHRLLLASGVLVW
jgi:transposase